MGMDSIIIKGAKEHNLKNVDLTIPRDKFIVFTGLSGSGKSSLAFDTIYADGQRRYMESVSSYARQFLGQMEKPNVESIEGLSPAISIDQKTTSKNPRSTVGTVTEIYDYLRLLYARVGTPHCPVCGREITRQTIDQIVDQLMALPEKTKLQIMAPVVRGRKGTHEKVLDSARRSGYVRVRIDGSVYDLSENFLPEKNKKHNVEIIVDRIVIKPEIQSRLYDSLETATNLTGGVVLVDIMGQEERLYSLNYACPEHNISMPKPEPNLFSFNNPAGACPTCTGLGTFMKVDPDLVVPDRSLSIRENAVKASGWYFGFGMAQMYYEGLAQHYGFSLDTPFEELLESVQNVILYGSGDEAITFTKSNDFGSGTYRQVFEGVIPNLERRFRDTQSNWVREEITLCMSSVKCPDCHGRRLRPEILAITVGGKNIMELCDLSVTQALDFLGNLELDEQQQIIAHQVLKEINSRLSFLKNVGLEYLTLSRSAGTLSGGESQRIRLATQIGSSLTGVLYILDEPSIGLHQRDNDKLLDTLKRLRDMGNTLIVVEHDEDTMRAADYIVDVGPGAGSHGGEIVAQGSVEDIIACPNSITGQYLSGKKKIPVPQTRRKPNRGFLKIVGAAEHNLKNLNVSIPLGTLTVVTGVSGSGKSSLVNEVIFKNIARQFYKAKDKPGKVKKIQGLELIDKIINIDQSPIGRTPRSNPATYTGVFTDIRNLFAMTNFAKMRGYGPGRFSFNVKGGRCEACQGDGIIKIEMHFLPDIYVPCKVCGGKRYNRETLEVLYKGKSIADVLDMTIEEACKFFETVPKIQRKLQTICDVGLGYVKMGQAATTLSGGEAQRVKLATELSKLSTGKTLYILDEPTTGLHIADVHKLIEMLQRLVDAGNTVLIIEHNLDVIKVADHIIDLGPEGGDRGGTLVTAGTPEEVALCPDSYTGKYLKKYLGMTDIPESD